MRILYLLFLLSLVLNSIILKAQGDYLPMESVTDWHITTFDFGGQGEYWLNYKGDSVIAGQSYRKIVHSIYPNLVEKILLREDVLDRKVYRYWPNEGAEYLYYDFTLETGDVTSIFMRNQYMQLEVLDVDSVNTVSGYLKRWYLSPQYGPNFYLLEGVGGSPLNYDLPLFVSDPVYNTTCAFSFCEQLFQATGANCDAPVYPDNDFTINETLCCESSITIGSDIYDKTNPSGITRLPGAGQNGCDSVVYVNLNFFQAFTLPTLNQTLCMDEEIIVNGMVFNSSNPSGTVVYNHSGCDTTQFVDLSFTPDFILPVINSTLCMDGEIIVNGTIYNSTNPIGTEVFNTSGCDSIQMVDLTFTPDVMLPNLDSMLCMNQEIVVNGIAFNFDNPSGTVVFDNLGCDSLQIVNLTFFADNDLDCITSTDDLKEASISIFPNPTHAEFYVISEQLISTLLIYNSLGQLVQTNYDLPLGTNRIEMNSQVNGVYYLRIIIEGKEKVLCLVKN